MKKIALILMLLLNQQVFAHDAKVFKGFKTPESVVSAKDGRVFVSEINEFGKDGDGQISVIEPNGKVRVYATGMDDPKGLAMHGENLYVADKTRILKVFSNGDWVVWADASMFPRAPQFLNDLEFDPQGNLYVSDSGDLSKGGAIFKITRDIRISIVADAESNPKIEAPNGLLMDDTGNFLLEVDFNSGVLYSINLKTREMAELARGFGGGDGLLHHPNGLMYVSDWKGGKLFSVKHDEPTLVKEGFKAAADIGLSHDAKYVIVPDMKAGEVVFVPIH